MSAFELPEEIMNAPVRFWMCLNREHKNVTWTDGVAHCPDCGLTSTMTDRFAAALRTVLADKIGDEDRDSGSEYERGLNVAEVIARGGGKQANDFTAWCAERDKQVREQVAQELEKHAGCPGHEWTPHVWQVIRSCAAFVRGGA